jgi:hypothetical protein
MSETGTFKVVRQAGSLSDIALLRAPDGILSAPGCWKRREILEKKGDTRGAS